MSASSSPVDPAPLDALDRRLLTEFAEDGRITNAALAKRLGIAESTCLQRVRSLRERGVIRGVHADVDLAALGFPIQAVVKVRLGSHNRDHVASFHEVLAKVPGALRILHVGGEDDYLIHVAVSSTQQLRDLVLEHLNVHPVVRHTETQLVFEEIPGVGVL
ncbi:Lrp/AsnC family transcriptional regulator [Nocardioides seonyuensis]|uniref:Lrp/AsnC family transcriptional regulator n=1 Tax=Nocardioides seonyuensis TaxID=2518371 RepID=A0A4P7IE94_9ACTN|nr:Lrp/AsnC family transcriptional regulator [Nocardioides seonyuensis]QBX55545.1 Lrp/AsnC family transcriptional regulator [Nocardioides seonyuensis]